MKKLISDVQMVNLIEMFDAFRDRPSEFSIIRHAVLERIFESMDPVRRQAAENYQSMLDLKIALSGSPVRASERLGEDLEESIKELDRHLGFLDEIIKGI